MGEIERHLAVAEESLNEAKILLEKGFVPGSGIKSLLFNVSLCKGIAVD